MIFSTQPSPVLLLGAAYAGKSELAMQWLAPDRPALVVGTADPGESAFAQRLARLKELRPGAWDTLEEMLDVPAALAGAVSRYPQALVDSVNQWLAALIVHDPATGQRRALAAVDELAGILARHPTRRFVLVTGEVGASLPAQRPLDHCLRQVIGLANQRLAAACRTVVEVKAGIAVVLKGG